MIQLSLRGYFALVAMLTTSLIVSGALLLASKSRIIARFDQARHYAAIHNEFDTYYCAFTALQRFSNDFTYVPDGEIIHTAYGNPCVIDSIEVSTSTVTIKSHVHATGVYVQGILVENLSPNGTLQFQSLSHTSVPP